MTELDSKTPDASEPSLKRSLSLPLVTFYGLGTMLGAGIYVLVGKVAERSGVFAPVAFCVASVIAGVTAFSYAELSSRYPRSAGEALYVEQAFRRKWLSGAVGWLVVVTGVVSSATIANGFVGYLHVFVEGFPAWLAVTLVVLGLGTLAAWGIRESVGAAAIITLLELAGLVFVLAVAGDSLGELPERWRELVPPFEGAAWSGITLGAFLAFYAFVGFEDMVNVAEEVKDVRRILPAAILISIGVASVLYALVALVAVLALPIDELAASTAPLADLVGRSGSTSSSIIALICVVAVVNGALVQIIMASRVIYGMARQGTAPVGLGAVHRVTRTPLRATVLVTVVILGLALGFPLVALAELTSTIILSVFALANLALVVVKRRGDTSEGAKTYPGWVPVLGFLLCVGFLGFQLWQKVF